jgi:hypothetical protein
MPGRFRYKGNAIGAGGNISVPFNEIIEIQAASSLPEIGGYGSATAVDFRYREILHFRRANSEVVGSQGTCDHGEPDFSTRIKATIEGLNIMDMVTADRVVANLVAKYESDVPGEPSVRFVGSRFENLRIAGIPVKVGLAVDVLDRFDTHKSLREAYGKGDSSVLALFGDAALRGRFHEAPSKVSQWFSHPMAVAPQMPAANGVSRVSLVSTLEPEDGGFDCWGHVIHVRGFGTIALGEVSISATSRSVTMIQICLNCPVEGSIMCCSAVDGCDPG